MTEFGRGDYSTHSDKGDITKPNEDAVPPGGRSLGKTAETGIGKGPGKYTGKTLVARREPLEQFPSDFKNQPQPFTKSLEKSTKSEDLPTVLRESSARYTFTDILPSDQRMLRYGDDESQILIPCAKVDNRDLHVGVLGIKNLKPDRFKIRGARDRQPIVLFDSVSQQTLTMSHPGKSAFLYFDDANTAPNLEDVVQRSMNRPVTRHDNLHLATVGALEEAGWQTWWTPLPSRGNHLHVRLVPDSIVTSGNDPTDIDRAALTAAFKIVS